MSNFHNKYHRHTHQTESTELVDSAIDPIASPDAPFNGDFYLDGKMSISGDICISGNLDMNSYEIFGYSATSEITGVVRIATSSEVSGRSATDCILTPKSLEYISSVLASHEVDGGYSIHTNVVASAASDGQTISYDGLKWVNSIISEAARTSATSGDALSGTDNVWISPAQLHLEIMRHMPKYSGYFSTSGWYAPVNSSTDYTIKFEPIDGGYNLGFSGVKIWTASGSSWVE